MTRTEITPFEIIGYLKMLDPREHLEIARTTADLKMIAQGLMDVCTRIDAPRTVKLLQHSRDLLQQEVNTLEDAIQQAGIASEAFTELTERRKLLENEQQQITDLSAQTKAVEELNAFVTGHDLKAMRDTLSGLEEPTAAGLVSFNQWLISTWDFFKPLRTVLAEETKQLLQNIRLTREEIDSAIAEASGELEQQQKYALNLLETYDKDLTEKLSKYNLLAEQLRSVITRLTEVRNNHEKNIQAYNRHLTENAVVFGELGKRHAIDDHMRELASGVERQLQLFDAEIKRLVLKADELTVS